MSAVFGIVFAPICGLILDYKVYRGSLNKLARISLHPISPRTYTENAQYFYPTNSHLD